MLFSLALNLPTPVSRSLLSKTCSSMGGTPAMTLTVSVHIILEALRIWMHNFFWRVISSCKTLLLFVAWCQVGAEYSSYVSSTLRNVLRLIAQGPQEFFIRLARVIVVLPAFWTILLT